MRAALFGLALSACLAACGAPPAPEDRAVIVVRALSAAPADARLARLYGSACKTCHTNADSAAPLTHDHGAWDARWAKGEETLLTHTVAGFNGMPAGGQCFACTADDYRALIAFMAGRED